MTCALVQEVRIDWMKAGSGRREFKGAIGRAKPGAIRKCVAGAVGPGNRTVLGSE